MACIFIQNLINPNNEVELVEKFDQFGGFKMINFILIHTKFQVNLFCLILTLKKKSII
jgi:hypothetical protein